MQGETQALESVHTSRWPPGDSPMAQRIRTMDWPAALGPSPQWPMWLRTSAAAMLDAPLPTILLVGPELVQVYNDAYQLLLGERHPASLGQPTRDCWPEVWDFNEPIYRGVLATGTSRHFIDQPYRIGPEGDRHLRYFTVTYVPLRDDTAAVRGVCVVALETTSRMQLQHDHEAVLRHARLAALQKDRFLAVLAHELRNPLAPIASVSAILAKLGTDDGKLARLGDILRRQAAHMTRLIDDLLDTSRVGRGELQLQLRPVDMRDVLEAALEQLAGPMLQRSHTVSTRLDEHPMYVQGDSARLVQVMANVLHNAAKYTPAGGRVELAAAADADAVVIEVRDNGKGIDPELLPRVFEPFSQGERAPGRQENGLGLGLSLVRSLVELHGGSVAASSAGLGTGSTFTVRLPVWAG